MNRSKWELRCSGKITKVRLNLPNNAGYNARMKHVDIRHHFIRENVAQDIIVVKYASTENELADILTKPFRSEQLK